MWAHRQLARTLWMMHLECMASTPWRSIHMYDLMCEGGRRDSALLMTWGEQGNQAVMSLGHSLLHMRQHHAWMAASHLGEVADHVLHDQNQR